MRAQTALFVLMLLAAFVCAAPTGSAMVAKKCMDEGGEHVCCYPFPDSLVPAAVRGPPPHNIDGWFCSSHLT